MVSIKSLATLASFAASATALLVDCRFDGQTVATVDLETGVCPFPIPAALPVNFNVVSLEDYLVDAYYVNADNVKFWNDIVNAGRIIDIPAISLFNNAVSGLFHVHLEKTPGSNSTAALRKRLFKEAIEKRATQAEIDAILALTEATPGTPVDPSEAGGEIVFEAVIAANQSSSASASGSAGPTASNEGTVTETDTETTVITITSCSDNLCSTTTAPATKGPVTTTIEGTETVYTTWCPITATETNVHTKIITITSCHDDKCHEVTTPATQGPTTTTIGGHETVYTTWCPVAETVTITVSHCENDVCVYSTVPATKSPVTTKIGGVDTVVTVTVPVTVAPGTHAPATVVPGTPVPTTVAPGTHAPGTVAPGTAAPTTVAAVSTYEGAGAKLAPLAVLAMIPLINLL